VAGAKILAEKLSTNTLLQHLNLFKNNISFDGAKAIGDCLKVNKTLKWLNVGHNRIRDKGLNSMIDGML